MANYMGGYDYDSERIKEEDLSEMIRIVKHDIISTECTLRSQRQFLEDLEKKLEGKEWQTKG